MRIVDGWRRIDNERGFVNETTGQNLVVAKKQFGEHYIVRLLSRINAADEEGTKISPEFSTKAKADAFAMDWMLKHPLGEEQNLQGEPS
jgi:hypothetical protein